MDLYGKYSSHPVTQTEVDQWLKERGMVALSVEDAKTVCLVTVCRCKQDSDAVNRILSACKSNDN